MFMLTLWGQRQAGTNIVIALVGNKVDLKGSKEYRVQREVCGSLGWLWAVVRTNTCASSTVAVHTS